MSFQSVSVKVHPHSKKELLLSQGPGRFEAWVKPKPMEGRANEAVVRLLAQALQMPPAAIRLIKGAHHRHKVFRILG
jgi:uncharacterized protein YggU (UPF0235/DUF167 family)